MWCLPVNEFHDELLMSDIMFVLSNKICRKCFVFKLSAYKIVNDINAFESLCLAVQALAGMVRDLEAQPAAMAAAAGAQYSTATDLADWLVRVLGMPFREAHGVVGATVAHAEALGQPLAELPIDDLRKFEPRITEDVYSVLSTEASVASRTSLGGTAPDRVQAAVDDARQRFLSGGAA